MAGLYLHIPFCRKACHYCNFHFSTSHRLLNDFPGALLKEMELQRGYLEGATVETIYFGGGTPSLLSLEQLDRIITETRKLMPVSDGVEITLEANPDDITPDGVKGWKQIGVNRLSLGVQSFFEEDLQWMNRAHDAEQAQRSIETILPVLPNLTIDLIYGTPTLSDERWRANIARAVAYGIPHLSCYALTVEPRTALAELIRQKKKPDVLPEDQARQFLILMEELEKAGYEHYEISNFARPGHRSRHNSAYWSGAHYLGLGPSAHSFNGVSRQWNVANNALYLKSLEAGTVPSETEQLSETDRFNEYVMTALRTVEGVDLGYISSQFGAAVLPELKRQLTLTVSAGNAEQTNNGYRLTREGKLLADGIAASMFR